MVKACIITYQGYVSFIWLLVTLVCYLLSVSLGFSVTDSASLLPFDGYFPVFRSLIALLCYLSRILSDLSVTDSASLLPFKDTFRSFVTDSTSNGHFSQDFHRVLSIRPPLWTFQPVFTPFCPLDHL